MSERFRKGQIVPRRLRAVLAADPRAQHFIQFGCDVVYHKSTFYWLHGDGPIIVIKANASRKMNNGTRRKSAILFSGDIRISISEITATSA